MSSTESPKQPDTTVVIAGSDQQPEPVLTRKEDLLTFLAAADELLDISEQHMLREQFLELTGEKPEDVRSRLPVDKVSKMTFVIEQRWNDINPHFIREEWEDRMQQLKKVVTKEQIVNTKTELLKAEQAGNEEEMNKLLEQLNMLRNKFD